MPVPISLNIYLFTFIRYLELVDKMTIFVKNTLAYLLTASLMRKSFQNLTGFTTLPFLHSSRISPIS
jgi:hypothetical protein